MPSEPFFLFEPPIKKVREQFMKLDRFVFSQPIMTFHIDKIQRILLPRKTFLRK